MGAGSAAVDPALRAIWAEVLGVEAPDVDDDFFALGGNSLLATQITARVADALGVEVALDALFEAPTLGAYAELVRAAAPAATARDRGAKDGRARRGGLRGLLRGRHDGERTSRPERGRRAGAATQTDELSCLEASAWSVQRYQPEAAPYVGETFALQGPLDVEALERAFTGLVARHELLRTSYPLAGRRPRPRVHPAEPFRLELVGGGRRMRDDEVRRHVDAAWSEPLDYETAPPLRARLIRSGRSAAVLVFLLHEIVCDGQAYDLLVRELGQLYAAETAGAPSPLATPAPRYRDVVRAHGPRLSDEDPDVARAHWREALAGAPLGLPLPHGPLGVGDPAAQREYARRSVQLPAPLVARLRALAQAESATSFMVHLAAYFALLHRWSGETDLLVRSPTANRARREWEQIAGFFSMVLPLRVDVGDDPSFRTLLRRTRKTTLAAFRHASYAPEDLTGLGVAGMQGLAGWSPLFRLWDPTTEQPLELPGVRARPSHDQGERGGLVLVVTERSDGRTEAVISSTSPSLDARAVGELLRHCERLLEQVAEDPDRRIGSELELLTPAERARLSGRAPARGADSDDGGLHGLVSATARRTPDAVALDPGGGAPSVSYAALDARAARIAALLRARGVGPGARVGLDLPPSGELAAAILGVLKAGAAAVPLREPSRDDAAGSLPAPAVVLDADALRATEAGGAPDDGDDAAVASDDVALVLCTTGVTDGPRAVALTHGALRRAALRQRDAQRLTPADRVAHVPGRGAWSWALAPWAALAAGATVIDPARAPQAHSATSPSGWLEAHAASVAAMDAQLAGAALERAAALPSSLRLLCVQGPGSLAAPPAGARLAVQRWYGLVETGGPAISGPLQATDARGGADPHGAAPLGEPSDLRARVLDRHGAVAPAGVVGALELHDGTHAIATGDLARRRLDGALELIGRAQDEQRWRGVRLRPIFADLELALAAHPGVQAAAACWEPDREALVACVVPRRAQAPDRRELDAWLQRSMTDWILPAAYAALESIPARADGQPDRRALAAAPAVARALHEAAEAEARDATERRIAGLWREVLGVRRVRLHDNFFAAGGMLLDGLELVGRARAAGIAIDPADLMCRPTIAALAAIAERR